MPKYVFSRREFLLTSTAAWMAGYANRPPILEGKEAESQNDGAAPAPLHPSKRTWQAAWIWDREPSREKNVYSLFRKRFELNRPARSAQALVTADSQYKLFVNGRFVGRGPARSNPAYLFFDTYEVGPYLRVGMNVVAAVVHFFGEGNERYMLGKEGFLFELAVETLDRRTLTIGSDATWKALRADAWDRNAPREHSNQGFIEILDLRRLPPGWTDAEFDDSSWAKPFVIGPPPQEPWKNLVPSLVPPPAEEIIRPQFILRTGEVKETPAPDPRLIGLEMNKEAILPVETVEIKNANYLLGGAGEAATISTTVAGRAATLVFDFGKEVSAVPMIEVEGTDGAVIDVGVSEVEHAGKPLVARELPGNGVISPADRLILREGRQSWERFFYTGFRYLQLTFRQCRQPVRVRSVGAKMLNYPFVDQGSFQCSDVLLNRLWEVGQYTLKACTYDTFVDCPWREKGQWVEIVTPLASYRCFDARKVAEAYLRTIASSQEAEGCIRIPYPSNFGMEMPEQSMWWGTHLWQHYLHFGDRQVLRDLYPNLMNLNHWFEKYLEPPGLLSTAHWMLPIQFPLTANHAWVWIDWGYMAPYLSFPDDERYAQSAALNCIYAQFLDDAAQIAGALEHQADARQFAAKARALRQVINEVYWSEKDGYYFDDVKHKLRADQASILAIVHDVAPRDRWARICKTLLSAKYELGYSSPHFYFFIFDALEKAGLYEMALEAMRVLYGGMLAQGATTLWELWNPGDTDSYCHGYSAGPIYSLSAAVLGVRPTGRGFSTFTVSPQIGSLDWAEGKVPTPTGPISVAWRKERENNRLRLSLGVPEGTQATVLVPLPPKGKGNTLLDDTLVTPGEQAKGAPKGVAKITGTPSGVEFILDPGQYMLVTE